MYVELHCHSHFSLLDGVSSPEALIARAAALQMPALALTDHDALYGAAAFGRAAQAAGVKPIFGAEVTVARPDLAPAIPTWGAAATYHLTLLAENKAGYANLSQLIAAARLRCEKGKAQATWEDLAQHSGGLIALSGCRRGLLAHHLLAGDEAQALRATHDLQNLFGQDRFYVELQRQLRPGDERLVQGLLALAGRAGAPVAASNNVHYAERAGHRLHDVLVAIRSHATLDASHAQRNGNSEAHLKGAGEMARLFADRPDALRRTLEIARRCTVSLRRGVQDLPRFPTGPLSPAAYLGTLCVQAMAERCGADPGDGVQRTLEHELAVIEQLGLANYFLIVWDIMRFARAQGIRCQGRGSAANSLVAFLLGITPIDPLAHGLVFERFLSTERPTAPDIDIDFQADRREEVIQYIYRRYGREHAAMACTFVTYRQRSAVRDVARALNFPPDLIDALAEAADRRGLEEAWRELWSAPAPSAPLDRRTWQLLLHLCNEIQRLPRHLGIHNGGFVLSRQPLAAIAPLEPATMAGRTVVQWDKEGLEDVGMVKIDVLGLRMLAALEEAAGWVEEGGGAGTRGSIELDRLTFDDPAVYAMLAAGDTVGVFQVESRAQAQLLPRMRPRDFADLVVEISLIRPGPVQAGMVHPYLRRRSGQEPVSYLHPSLEPALRDTLGVVVFQEQVLKVAQALAGWSGGQGELLRRALGRKDGEGEMARLRRLFVADAAARGVSPAVAGQVFSQLAAFGSYSFAKSHAAAFAVIVYQSAWLKRYHPLPFYLALLNNQPMGFWSPAVLVNDARRHGIALLPADVNQSAVRYAPEDNGEGGVSARPQTGADGQGRSPERPAGAAIRIGLATVKGLGERGAERIVAVRADRPFASLLDFCRRTRLPRAWVENLIVAGALDAVESCEGAAAGARRGLLWQLGLLRYEEETLLAEAKPDPAPDELPPLPPLEAMAGELRVMGVSAGAHVMAHHRQRMREAGMCSSHDLAQCHSGMVVWVAGQVTVLQSPPTAKGFMFVTLEDEFGMINVIVAPDVVARYRRIWRHAPLLAVQGRIQRQGPVVNLLAVRPWRMSQGG